MATPPLTTLLDEARAAYHLLQTGKAVASARDSNGEEVRYTQASRADLADYIADLLAQIDAAAGAPSQNIGPMRVFF